MLGYNDMIKCGQKYAFEKKQMLIEKYKAFIDYLKNVILITFGDNKEQIVSYLKKSEDYDYSFLLDWCVGGIHYDGFYINTQGNTIDVELLRAHDSYYDPSLDLTSDIKDDDLLSFFDKEYDQFLELFVPDYYTEQCEELPVDKKYSLVCKIANKFNEVCFDHFKTNFSSLGIYDLNSFVNSKYSLSFTDERRKELDKEVYECYQTYVDKVNELTKRFDEAVKDLK